VKRLHVIAAIGASSLALLTMQACSGDNNNGSDSGTDASNQNDVGTKDVATKDVVNDVINDVVTTDASDASTCPLSWTAFPDAGEATSVLTPDGGLPASVILHAAGVGTQDYVCKATTGDAGTTYAWALTGPDANLEDCNQAVIGHHFASEAGAAAPEWQTTDQSFVIGKKVTAYDASAASVPWLLLQETSNGGTGTIAKTLYVQRLFTSGGWPTATCDGNNVGGTTTAAYTADYYFYGP
jgi:hypothetical protein